MKILAHLLLCSSVLVGCAPATPRHVGAAVAAPSPSANAAKSAPANDADAIAAGRLWTAAFYDRQTQKMWNAMSDGMRKVVGDKNGIDSFRSAIDDELGPEAAVVEEKVERDGADFTYVRVAKFEKQSVPFKVIVGISGSRIDAFAVKPAKELGPAPTTKLDYKTRAPLRLPFDGTWFVGWGGRTLEQNQHVVMRDQRFAYDFLVTKNGETHRGDGKANTDYFCYGQKLLAPAAGRIITTVDGIPDNVPGQMDPEHAAGNYVIIDHGSGEFSLLAHLQPRSLAVKDGDDVVGGQLLGLCGNSGNSSEPHLHYQLQNGPKYGDADGLPAQFRGYVADDKPVANGEPIRGQTIKHAPREHVKKTMAAPSPSPKNARR